MARRLLSLVLMILVCSMAGVGYAQVPSNLDMVDVKSLPESTVKKYAEQAKKKGYSLDDILAQYKIRGADDLKVEQLKQRLSKYFSDNKTSANSSTGKTAAAATKTGAAGTTTKETDERLNVVFTREDSLVFGFHIFNKRGLTFEPSLNVAVSDSYIVGIGDNLRVEVYGAADNSYDLVVDNGGKVYFPMVGTVSVGGKTLKEARVSIDNALRRIYGGLGSSTHTSIQVVEVQPVSVSVVGEAFMPGTYSVSSTSSLFNVLYLSGGPNSKGSYRDVQLIRGGKVIEHLDIYDFLVNGNGNVNVKLADGDIVLIPTYQKRVSVGGEFKHVGFFEAKEGETVADLIRYAGGFSPKAQTSHVNLFKNNSFRRELVEVVNPEQIKLDNGDSLAVDGIRASIVGNWVDLRGGVRAPGFYAYKEGFSLKELLDRAGGLVEGAYTTRGLISRRKEDFSLTSVSFDVAKVLSGEADETLQPYDEVTIMTIDDIREVRKVSINGSVNSPGEFEYRENLTLSDLILLAGGLKEDASLGNVEVVRMLDEAERQSSMVRSGQVLQLEVTRDLAEGAADNSFVLQPYDMVNIRRTLSSHITSSVRLIGAFVNSGEFDVVDKGVRVSDMVKRAGGLTLTANLDGAYIFRRIWVLPRERMVKLYQSSARDDTVFYLKSNAIDCELVSINLRKALAEPGSKYDVKLLGDDELVVPDLNETVRIMGSVQNPNTTTWIKGWNAKKYIKRSGGFAIRSKAKKTYVIYPNGQSKGVSHILCFRKYPEVTPGSEIVVPQKEERVTLSAPAIVSMVGSGISSLAIIMAFFLK